MLNGLAAADAGEYLSPRQKTAFLERADFNVVNVTDPAPVMREDVVVTSPRRSVAMYMGSGLPAAMMDYVIDTCASLDHDLTVMTFEARNVSDNLLAPYAEALAEKGIAMKVAKLSGEPLPGLARYLRKHPEVVFLACKDTGYLGRNYMNGTQAGNTLPVPVVVVVTEPGAATAQPAEQVAEEGKVGAA